MGLFSYDIGLFLCKWYRVLSVWHRPLCVWNRTPFIHNKPLYIMYRLLFIWNRALLIQNKLLHKMYRLLFIWNRPHFVQMIQYLTHTRTCDPCLSLCSPPLHPWGLHFLPNSCITFRKPFIILFKRHIVLCKLYIILCRSLLMWMRRDVVQWYMCHVVQITHHFGQMINHFA